MKTFNRIIIIAGIVCAGFITVGASNILPGGYYITPKTTTYIEVEKSPLPTHIAVSDNTNLVPELPEDTILMDLSGERMVEPFPTTSRDCIVNQVPYPEFARGKNLQGGVTVRFQFDEYGTVTVLESCSNSTELEKYVREKMNYLQLKNCVVDINKDYYMRFIFRLI